MKKDFTDNDKEDLKRAVKEKFGAKTFRSVFGDIISYNISPESSFTKKLIELGCDKTEAGEWGISALNLNKNNLNSEYNNHEKLPWIVNYFA